MSRENSKAFALSYMSAVSKKHFFFFALFAILSLGLDQYTKFIMLDGFSWESEALSIGGEALVYNTGVAFSMFAFLTHYLKYIQILLLCFLFAGAICSDFFVKHYVPFGVLIGAGISNILDRFMYGGVVDYIYWHYWFNFAIFNLADVLIDVSVVVIFWQIFREKKRQKVEGKMSAH